MEYNTQRSHLTIPVYGRNIQKMIDQCIAIEDKEKRTKTAELIINVMSQMTPKNREIGDFKQKLWDHIMIISDFKLDVDSPYPPPDRSILTSKPEKVPYQDNHIRFRHYGKNIEAMIKKAVEFPEGNEKDTLVKTIANHMKKSYLNWNRSSVDDSLILLHLDELSGHQLKPDANMKLARTSDILAMNKKKKAPVKTNNNNKGRKKYQ